MIRKATLEDASRLAEIHIFGWRCTYRGIVSDKYLFARLSVSKRIAAFQKTLSEGIEETYVYDDGIVKGFMTIGKCRDEDKPDSFELWGIYLDPCFKRNGIGRQLLAFCEAEARRRSYREITLWVFKENADSRKFYESMGFKPDGKEQEIEFFRATEVRYAEHLH